MAWIVRSTATNVSNGSSTSVTVTIPADVQPGDYILETVVATANGATAAQTPPAGWTAISSLTTGNSSTTLRGAYRRVQIGDAGTLATFTLNVSTRWAVILTVIYDDAGGVPRIEQLTQGSGGQTTVIPTPAIDPVNNDDLLIAVFGGAIQTNGTTVTLGANPSFTLQAQACSSSLTLKNGAIGVASMVLSDGNPLPSYNHSSTANVAYAGASLLISSHNTPPTADAGPDQTVNPGAVVTLDGSGSSDFDGSLSAYAWTQISGPTVALSNTAVVQPTFTAPSSVEASVLVFGLIVTDDEGTPSTQDTVNISVGAMSFEHVWDGSAMHKQPIRHWVGNDWTS